MSGVGVDGATRRSRRGTSSTSGRSGPVGTAGTIGTAGTAGPTAHADVVLTVRGMTCASCERRITRRLLKVRGVSAADVSFRRGTATVRTDGSARRQDLVHAVRAAGYEVASDAEPWFSRDRSVWRDVATAVGVLAVVGLLLQVTGVTGLADQVGTLATSGSLVLVLVLGVAAGLSTCMALVGGLVLTVSASHAQRHPEASGAARLRPAVVFNVGRVAGFAVLGAATGYAGSMLALSGHLVAVLMVLVSLVMAGVGLRLTGASPRLSRAVSLSLPPGLTSALRLDRARGAYSDGRTAALGAGTYLLPCGFTQAVQVYAMSTGSPGRAAAIMTLFALGTVPGLIGVGGLTALARGAAAQRFFRFAGVAVLAFAAVNVSGSLGVLAPGIFAPPATAAVVVDSDDPTEIVSANVTLDGTGQTLRTTQVGNGYEPAQAVVLAGRPISWEIDSVAMSCAASLYAPELGIAPRVLEPGLNVLELTVPEPGTYRYSCGMGMYWGSITVVADPQA